ncbi:MFS transporter [Amycolatopsis bartoniae]|uniref:MFS transporter n=1 Tax=Amycolatopsis bartoniae TaxID=941986 RepID=A0A8H9MDT0_9PSEU|nr:MFS transporter [Amycolatopsis bartoniae]GHF72097.1 MFS transporter [Amycolatopsis bartoniae]
MPATVFALGSVSLLTDVSAEMVTAFLPVYLLYTLQLGYVQFGLLDGLYNGATAILRLVGGYVADRLRRPKLVAMVGYGGSALMKLAFPLAGGSAFGIGGILAADRAGKGLRTAPRDALISLATPSNRLGHAFGVHRAMDTFGALLGPLVTFWIMSELGTGSSPVFFVSFCFAALGFIVLAAFVRDGRRSGEPLPARNPVSLRACLGLLRERRLRRATIAAGLLGLATISDAFVFVVLQSTTAVPLSALPLLPLGTALVFLLGAIPLGRVADRIGRWPVFFGGHMLLLGLYALLLTSGGGYPILFAGLALHGLFYAATDGVLMAYAGPLVPEQLRASGLAVVQTGQAVARLISSSLFGVLLANLTKGTSVLITLCVFVVALSGAAALVRGRQA